MPNDDPVIGGSPLSEWEMWFSLWKPDDDDPTQTLRGFLANESLAIPLEWRLTTRWLPRKEHEDGPFTDELRRQWDEHAAESRQDGAGGEEGVDQGTDAESGPERATGAYNAITGTFGIHPATKWGTEQ